MPRMIRKSHRGRTMRGYVLTEMLITVAIIAVVLSTVAAIASSESSAQQAKQEARMIEGVADDLRLILARQTAFTGVNLGTTINLDLWPESRVNGGNVVNVWGGDIQLLVANGLDPSGKSIRINVLNVPQAACSTFATYDYSYERLVIDGTVAFNRGQFGGAAINPVDVAVVANECADNLNTVSLFFTKDVF